MKSYFKEVQQMPEWIRKLTLLSSILMVIGTAFLLFNDGEIPLQEKVISSLFMIIITALVVIIIYQAKMTIETDRQFVRITMSFILPNRKIPYAEIERVTKGKRFLLGWGYHFNFSKGEQFNFGGKEGIMLHLTKGRQIFLSTNKANELASIIEANKNGKKA